MSEYPSQRDFIKSIFKILSNSGKVCRNEIVNLVVQDLNLSQEQLGLKNNSGQLKHQTVCNFLFLKLKLTGFLLYAKNEQGIVTYELGKNCNNLDKTLDEAMENMKSIKCTSGRKYKLILNCFNKGMTDAKEIQKYIQKQFQLKVSRTYINRLKDDLPKNAPTPISCRENNIKLDILEFTKQLRLKGGIDGFNEFIKESLKAIEGVEQHRNFINSLGGVEAAKELVAALNS